MVEPKPPKRTAETDNATPVEAADLPQLYVKDDQGEFVPVSLEPVESPDEPTLPGILSQSYQRSFHSGPLPAVEEYRAYGEVVPDAPERILRMAERDQEAKHRIIEKQIVQNSRAVSQGQWMGFTTMLVALVGAIYLASTGQPTIAALLAGPSVLVPIMRFYFHGKHEVDQGHAA